ncbi:MAG: A/G-specific adenine glycosylase [Oscillibacter sp.]|nr:A/G-specific adenine glycosylase [Oscillibacter sp.]
MNENLVAIVSPLLDWYDVHKRTLPWRGTEDPYKVLVSEIMLQQTRVAAVIPYYLRWMEELPTVEALAEVDEERLMKLWQGLGYYSRAKNLRRAARMVMDEFGGRFPGKYEELLRLPGVGDYTAGAVASIAFGQRVPAVDGNVLRVAARVTGADGDILDPKVRRQFRGWMEAVTPSDQPGKFNQALMDLGATVCLPSGAPDCDNCPLEKLCEANRLGIQETLPVRRKKAARRVEELTVYLLMREGKTALRRRADTGLLAGLWEFPNVPGSLDEEHAGEPLAEWGLTALDWRKKLTAKHIFTHVEWHMTGYLLETAGEGSGLTWADREELEALAVPSAFTKFLEEARRALEKEAAT